MGIPPYWLIIRLTIASALASVLNSVTIYARFVVVLAERNNRSMGFPPQEPWASRTFLCNVLYINIPVVETNPLF